MPPHVLVVGNDIEALDSVVLAIQSYFQIDVVPLEDVLLLEPDLPSYGAVIIYHESASENGLNILWKLRQSNNELPILLVAHDPSREEVIAAYRLGVTDFFILPLNAKELSLKIKSVVKTPKLGVKPPLLHKLGMQLQEIISPSRTPLALGIVHSNPILDWLNQDKSTTIALEPDARKPFQPCFFGSFQLGVSGEEGQKLSGKKARSVLAYLFYNNTSPLRKEVLMDTFWPDIHPDCVRNNLNVLIHNLRKYLSALYNQEEVILYEEESYRINSDLVEPSDVQVFHNMLKTAKRLESNKDLNGAMEQYFHAVRRYEGDFLLDLMYEPWTEMEREHLKEVYLTAMDKLCWQAYQHGLYQECIQIGEKILEKDPVLEQTHLRVMKSYAQLQRRDLVIKQFQKCENALQTHLGVPPSKEIKELYEGMKS